MVYDVKFLIQGFDGGEEVEIQLQIMKTSLEAKDNELK